MEEQKLFQIGEVARLFHLSVSSLRHYEAAGLLTPEYVDPASNYRYYSVRQFEVLNTIRYLRALDMPLPQIAAFLKNRDIPVMEAALRQQKNIVAEKARELRRIERKIENRLQQLSDAQRSVYDLVRPGRLKSCRVAWVKTPLKIQNFFDMEAPIRALEGDRSEAVVFLGKVGVGISAEDLRAAASTSTTGSFWCWTRRTALMGRPSPCRRRPASPSGSGAATPRPGRLTKSCWPTSGNRGWRWTASPVRSP